MSSTKKRVLIAILIVVGVVIIDMLAFALGFFNMSGHDAFYYPDSEWASSDGKMTISICGEYESGRADFGILTYEDDSGLKQYGLFRDHGKIRIIAETSPFAELVTKYDKFSTVYITDNHMVVCFPINTDSPPYLDEGVPEWKRYVLFKRVK